MEKFKKYDKMFADDTVSAQILYPRALVAFITEGDSANARKLFKKAFDANSYVVKSLLDKDFKLSGVKSFTWGSPEEAEVYLIHAIFTWYDTEGAMEWLLETVDKILSKKMAAKPAKAQPKSKKVWLPYQQN
jgi:hypothetical protein